LLQTCFLDRLTGPLCDAVRFGESTSPGQSSAAILERLERANLFIVPLDGERCWYRYHRLFADLLCQRLRSSQLEQFPMLHNRASEWCERNGFTDEAIGYAVRGEHFERAADLIESSVDTIWQGGEHSKLQRWLVGLPVELVASRPQLCIYNAWGLFVSGQHDAAVQSLYAAESALNATTARAVETSTSEPNQRYGCQVNRIRAVRPPSEPLWLRTTGMFPGCSSTHAGRSKICPSRTSLGGSSPPSLRRTHTSTRASTQPPIGLDWKHWKQAARQATAISS
jgi:hypothetical protein